MCGYSIPGIHLKTAICVIAIILFPVVTADHILLPSIVLPQQNSVPIFDAVQYQTQTSVEKEDITPGMTMYVQRPYGYIKSTQSSLVNLSIIKTEIERISKSTAVIKGEIKNLDEKTIDLIVITFNLYNADGDQIGNAYTSIDYLAPKSTWKFVTDPIERSDFQFEQYGSIYAGVFG
jgi:hypothetical protein